MLRCSVLPLFALLVACAPMTQSAGTDAGNSDAASFRAAYSDAGVAWVSGGKACVARAPSFWVNCPKLAPVSAVAWEGQTAWALLPGPGLVVTLDLAPRSLSVGAADVLSSTHIYRRDGSALSYSGEPSRGVAGGPTAALTGGDGQEYVLLGGQLRRVSDGAVLEPRPRPFLYATPSGAATALLPTAADRLGSYYLTGTTLEYLAAGQVVARVLHGPGRVGIVGNEVVTVSASGQIRRFTAELRPLSRVPGRGDAALATAPDVRVP